jgi:phosphatidylinositol-3-phosphatase
MRQVHHNRRRNHPWDRAFSAIAVSLCLLTIAACGSGVRGPAGAAGTMAALQVPQSKHVVLVMLENQSYPTVVGNTAVWPNLNALIAKGSLPTNYYANLHYSIGNYFMLTTGVVVTKDDRATAVWDVDNIARRMLASGVSFKVYAESASRGYLGGNTGLYVLRHNPFARLSDIADSPQVADQTLWPFTQFAADLAGNALPEFSFIIPNDYHDGDAGPPQQVDTWLENNVLVPPSSYPAFQPGGDGILIVEFDEGAFTDLSNGGGHTAPVFWGPNVNVGYTQTSATLYQHQSMLRTVMEALQLPNPPGAAANAPSMGEFFVQKQE